MQPMCTGRDSHVNSHVVSLHYYTLPLSLSSSLSLSLSLSLTPPHFSLSSPVHLMKLPQEIYTSSAAATCHLCLLPCGLGPGWQCAWVAISRGGIQCGTDLRDTDILPQAVRELWCGCAFSSLSWTSTTSSHSCSSLPSAHSRHSCQENVVFPMPGAPSIRMQCGVSPLASVPISSFLRNVLILLLDHIYQDNISPIAHISYTLTECSIPTPTTIFSSPSGSVSILIVARSPLVPENVHW